MKPYLAAVVLTAALVQPVLATTFPTLTTIYVGSGVQDGTGSSATTGTAVSCSNVSGATASIRVAFLNHVSVIVGQATQTLFHGRSTTFTTRSHQSISQQVVTTGGIPSGVVNIESTESGVFCTAMLLDSAPLGPNGVALNLVRVNPHPGTVE